MEIYFAISIIVANTALPIVLFKSISDNFDDVIDYIAIISGCAAFGLFWPVSIPAALWIFVLRRLENVGNK